MALNSDYEELFKKKYLKIGIVESVPWSYIPEGEKEWKGFCIDLINTLAEGMNFSYELVVSEEWNPMTGVNASSYGGLIKDLVEGKVDLAVAAMTMTAGRAELVDFVTPYFDNSGISTVVRRPIRQSSFFSFLTVLSLGVWLSIVSAILITALVIWLIEKLSPSDSCYPNSRKFTLQESIWFSLTTFASQGTGDIPAKTPHRVLIAAYWIFVLAMMTTFTANLAAFLTIERLKTPVSSLGELMHSSRIKYTVVRNSRAHLYFKNMKFAEDTLFRIWKDLALAQTIETENDYRTWDYPIREEFRSALATIEGNSPVPNITVGLQKVLENEKGEFALIHETAELRYYAYQDCRLSEIGEMFGERPYSIAVRKKSKVKHEINLKILDLHEKRYFETLSAKYWNASNLLSCSTDEHDLESVTLESLGGVFIAASFGILLALMALAGEISVYNRHKKKFIHETLTDQRFFYNPSKPNISRLREISKRKWNLKRIPRNTKKHELKYFLTQFLMKLKD